MYFHKISDVHYWTENRRITLGGDGHDLWLMEHGWECNCEGFTYRHDCAHVRNLCLQLYGPPLVVSAREAVKRSGLRLEDIYPDYSAPAPVTNRERVKQRPSY